MFIGEKQVQSIENGLVTYIDGNTEQFSEEYAKYFATEEKMIIDEFYIHKTHKIISDIMKLLVDSNSTMSEAERIGNGLFESLRYNRDKAVSIMFGVENITDINFKTVNEIVLNKS